MQNLDSVHLNAYSITTELSQIYYCIMQLPARVALIGDIVPLKDEKVYRLLQISEIIKPF